MLLSYSVHMCDERDVFLSDTTFIIRIAYLIAAGYVLEGYGEIVSPTQLVMDFLAELPGDARVHASGEQIRQERIMDQRYYSHIFHVFLDVRFGRGHTSVYGR